MQAFQSTGLDIQPTISPEQTSGMETETGTIYTLETISKHTGLDRKYLSNPDGPLRRIKAMYPHLSPDSKGLTDEGLMVLDEYLRLVSNTSPSGKRQKPQMTFEQFKEYMNKEYYPVSNQPNSESSNDTPIYETSSYSDGAITLTTPQEIVSSFEQKLDQSADVIAERIGASFEQKMQAKVKAVLAQKLAGLEGLLDQITQ